MGEEVHDDVGQVGRSNPGKSVLIEFQSFYQTADPRCVFLCSFSSIRQGEGEPGEEVEQGHLHTGTA